MNKITKAQQKKQLMELRATLLSLMETGIVLYKKSPDVNLMTEIKEMGRLSLDLKEQIKNY